MRKLNLTIGIGLVAALLGTALVFMYGQGVEKRIADGRKLISVLVATGPLAAGESSVDISDRVSVEKVPQAYVANGAIGALDAVDGQVLSAGVSEGSQLTPALFSSPQELALLEPESGFVAVAVQVGLSPGVARYVQAGSNVDVFVTYKNVDAGAASATFKDGSITVEDASASNRTKLFLSGVKVLSVSVAAPRTEEEVESQGRTSVLPNEVVAVFEVRPQDAERLVNAATLGDLYLALSAKGEKHTTPKGATPDDVVRANRP